MHFQIFVNHLFRREADIRKRPKKIRIIAQPFFSYSEWTIELWFQTSILSSTLEMSFIRSTFLRRISTEFVVPWAWLLSRCLFKELIKIFILIPCSFRENSEKLEFSSPYWNSSKFGWLNNRMNVACLGYHALVQFFLSWVIYSQATKKYSKPYQTKLKWSNSEGLWKHLKDIASCNRELQGF